MMSGPPSTLAPVAKRALDLVLSALVLVATAPVSAATALAVRRAMGSPILFRQRRAGRHPRTFDLIKFRTMRHPEPGEEGPEFDGNRLGPLGQFLRATSIDELPSLWNVIRGEMSLVGPRPLPVRYLARYDLHQARRHEVRPGLTGWAQVHGRNQLPWPERFDLDVWYVDHRCLRLDLRILAMTVTQVLRRSGVSQDGHATMAEFTGKEVRGH